MRLELRLERGGLKAELDGVRAIRLDAEGRWASLREGPDVHRRMVDGSVRQQAHGSMLAADSEEAVHERAAVLVAELQGLARDPSMPGLDCVLSGSEASPDELRARLRRAGEWGALRLLAEKRRFAAVYPERVPILPPDRYADLVVQPATGCPNAGCTFCAFYRDSRFRVLTDEEFAEHLRGVQELFGRALRERGGVFLGSANALAVPQKRLESMLVALGELPLELRRGVAGFWDPEHAPRRDARDWARLHELGLVRVHVGLETGDAELRAAFGKEASLAALFAGLPPMRGAGLRLGVSVLALGDREPEELTRHREASARAVAEMQLTREDFVYVSPLLCPESERLEEEARELEAALRRVTAGKVVPYAAQRFGYYA